MQSGMIESESSENEGLLFVERKQLFSVVRRNRICRSSHTYAKLSGPSQQTKHAGHPFVVFLGHVPFGRSKT